MYFTFFIQNAKPHICKIRTLIQALLYTSICQGRANSSLKNTHLSLSTIKTVGSKQARQRTEEWFFWYFCWSCNKESIPKNEATWISNIVTFVIFVSGQGRNTLRNRIEVTWPFRFVSTTTLGSIAAHDCPTGQSIGRKRASAAWFTPLVSKWCLQQILEIRIEFLHV